MGIDIKLSKKRMDKLNSDLNYLINKTNGQFESHVQSKIIERRKLYEADKKRYLAKYPKISRITDVVSTDVHDTIESMIPSIMRLLFLANDIVSLRGTNEGTDAQAKTFEKLLNFQVQRNREGFMIFYDWVKYALIDNLGILKCWWEYEEISETKQAKIPYAQFAQLAQMPRIRVLKWEDDGEGSVDVKYEIINDITKNQPMFAAISPSEFRYDINTKDIREADFIAHRMIVTADWLKRQEREGVLTNVARAIKNYGSSEQKRTTLDTYESEDNATLMDDSDRLEDAKKEYIYYECWYETDINNDGILEKVVVGKIGDRIVRLEENTVGEHPFFTWSPTREPYKVMPNIGIADLSGEIQDIITALLRQIVGSIATANDRQAFVNDDVMLDVSEFIEGEKAVRVSGDPSQAVYWAPWEAIDQATFPLLEYLSSMKENRTGITKYNQGMDSSSLNKTATGISRIMEASNQRNEMVLRLFVESGLKPLYRHLIKLNKMYITEPTVIRIAEDYYPVDPEDLSGKVDIDVNIALAMGTAQEKVDKLMVLLNLYAQAIPAGIAGNQHAAHALRLIVQEFGYKDASNFSYSPDEAEQNAQQQQEAMQQQAQQAIEAEMQKKLAEIQAMTEGQVAVEEVRQQGQIEQLVLKSQDKFNEKVFDEINKPLDDDKDSRRMTASIPIKDVPPAAGVQMLEQMGIQTSEKEFDDARKAAQKPQGDGRVPSSNNRQGSTS